MYYQTDYLSHYGIKGQKWGVRRFQNEDGSYTEEGKARYNSVRGSQKDIHSISGNGGTFGGVGRTGRVDPLKAQIAVAATNMAVVATAGLLKRRKIKNELKKNDISESRLTKKEVNKLTRKSFNKKERQMVYDKLKSDDKITLDDAMEEANKHFAKRMLAKTGAYVAASLALSAIMVLRSKHRDSVMKRGDYSDFMQKVRKAKLSDVTITPLPKGGD